MFLAISGIPDEKTGKVASRQFPPGSIKPLLPFGHGPARKAFIDKSATPPDHVFINLVHDLFTGQPTDPGGHGMDKSK